MERDLKKIFDKFQIEGTFIEAVPHGNGHINDTFVVTCDRDGKKVRYIFQRINKNVFKNPPMLMDNISRVTSHIRGKLEAQGVADIDRRVLTLVPAVDNRNYCVDDEGKYWRAYVFIENAKTFDVMEDTTQGFQAARAFGEFQKTLVDLPQPPLFETIPDFHNGQKKYDIFQQALRADAFNRAIDAKPEIEFLESNAWIFDVFPKLIAAGKIPIRITHNDTKINNVIIDDRTHEGICVIDLDTVMPGIALYDLGDILRTTLTQSAEDERDLSMVEIQMPRFESVIRGYLAAAGEFLNETERQHLVFSGQMITLIIGTRFLTDYLSGDTYFKVHRPGHNLDRCRTQFKLVSLIAEKEEQMHSLIESQNN